MTKTELARLRKVAEGFRESETREIDLAKKGSSLSAIAFEGMAQCWHLAGAELDAHLDLMEAINPQREA